MSSSASSSSDAQSESSSSATGLRDIHQLISECHVVLQADPSCLHTRAVRGHACMKAKLWDQAVRDFSEILRCRPDDVHGRFSRGMALFKSGRVDDAHRDFSRVLELNPNHVMARYARAGCYNSEGEFSQAIQEYTLALQHDEKENAGGFRVEKRRIGMHESAEHLIRKTMGVTAAARLRSTSLPQEPSRCNENRFSPSSLEDSACHACHAGVIQISPKDLPSQSARPRSESVPGKRPRKVVQVRVNLSEFVAAPPQSKAKSCIPTTSVQEPRKISECPENSTAPRLEVPSNANGRTLSQQQTLAPRVLAVRAVPKAVRRVTVAL